MGNNTTNLLAQTEIWVAEALWRSVTPEELDADFLSEINYAVSMTALPDPSKFDVIDESVGLIPALVIFLEIPSNEEGETIYSAPVLAPFTLTQERINEVVKKTLDSLKEARDNSQVDKPESDS